MMMMMTMMMKFNDITFLIELVKCMCTIASVLSSLHKSSCLLHLSMDEWPRVGC
jgi:hypothetical protein